MIIYKEFIFESAHYLPNLPSGHKCGRLHGHSYRVQIYVEGDSNNSNGWVIDYKDIHDAFLPLYEQLDHCLLNDIVGLENPTAENIAKWIWSNLIDRLPILSKVVINETSTSGAIYCG